ncbi:MAG: phosphoglycerate kinase [Candidatus Pacebacteria bacterium]|nr:phosphoglycerate kinase [Candidatus Paceibacterota bacterium]MBP9840143.1 phosphoglycerate kinase [Candidatus Paceibacterota bacterium]
MRSVRDIPVLENIPVLVRAALNAEVEKGKVTEDYRLRAALPTIEYLAKRHARVVLLGHISGKGTESLRPMQEAMKKWIPSIAFCPTTSGEEARAAIRALSPGGVLMLENLRRDVREEKNDPAFARELAELGDIFIEDAFDVCHRAHASVVGIPKFLPSYAGLLVEKEVNALTKALAPATPSLAIIGGAKFSTKEPVLAKLINTYDQVFIGGALANDFIQASGKPVGTSLVSGADQDKLKMLLATGKILLPIDYVVAPKGKTRNEGRVCEPDEVLPEEAILDNGPASIALLNERIQNAKTVLWNGPLGNYENGFVEGTEALAVIVARAKAYSILGGGDTVAAIEKTGVEKHIDFVSTGGGAMLEFLASGTLPGLKALS